MSRAAYQKIRWSEAEKLYGFGNKVNFGGIPEKYLEDTFVAVFEGDLALDYLEFDGTRYFLGFADLDITGLIVNGDMTVSKYINLKNTDVGIGAHVWVKGNLSVDCILISSMGDLSVDENILVNDFVIATDSAGGRLTCEGSFTCKNTLVAGFSVYLKKNIEGVVYIENPDHNFLVIDSEDQPNGNFIEILNNNDLLCVCTDELEDTMDDDDDDNDEKWQEITKKTAIFDNHLYVDADNALKAYLDGKKIFRDLDIDSLFD